MAQVLAGSSLMGTSLLTRDAGSSRVQSRQPLQVQDGMIRGNRFGPRRAARQQNACRPRSFYAAGPQFGMGCGPGGFRMSSGGDLSDMLQDLEKVFGAWGGPADATSGFNQSGSRVWVPVDVVEEAVAYVFIADLPGITRADTKVQANKEERVLTISGQRIAPERSEEQQKRRRRTERRFGNFKRTFKLPDDADLGAGAISATFRDGVLTVSVKRTQPVEPEVTDVPIDDWFDVKAEAPQQPSEPAPETPPQQPDSPPPAEPQQGEEPQQPLAQQADDDINWD